MSATLIFDRSIFGADAAGFSAAGVDSAFPFAGAAPALPERAAARMSATEGLPALVAVPAAEAASPGGFLVGGAAFGSGFFASGLGAFGGGLSTTFKNSGSMSY